MNTLFSLSIFKSYAKIFRCTLWALLVGGTSNLAPSVKFIPAPATVTDCVADWPSVWGQNGNLFKIDHIFYVYFNCEIFMKPGHNGQLVKANVE